MKDGKFNFMECNNASDLRDNFYGKTASSHSDDIPGVLEGGKLAEPKRENFKEFKDWHKAKRAYKEALKKVDEFTKKLVAENKGGETVNEEDAPEEPKRDNFKEYDKYKEALEQYETDLGEFEKMKEQANIDPNNTSAQTDSHGKWLQTAEGKKYSQSISKTVGRKTEREPK